MSQCDVHVKGSCENQSQGSPAQNENCGCPIVESVVSGCCPTEFVIKSWAENFPQAMKAVQIDLLKEKIRKAWGDAMEKEADAILQRMGLGWAAALTEAKANMDLRESFKKIIEEALSKKK